MPGDAPLVGAITLGRVLASIRFEGIEASEVEYPALASFPRHSHARAYVCLLLRGSFEERLGGRSHEVTSAGVVVMPARAEHDERFGSRGARSFVITFDRVCGSVEPAMFAGGPVVRAALALCRACRRSGALAQMAVEEHLAELVGCAGGDGAPRGGAGVADRAREVLAARLGEPLRLAAVAGEVGCDPAYLARAFRRRYGCTMSGWLRRRRVEEAARRLDVTDDGLAAVAQACGFADQSHLSRTFQAQLGVSPGGYRRLIRE